MELKQRTGIKCLMANRNKGQTSKEAPKTQVAPDLPLPPLPPIDFGLQANSNLRKKRPIEDLKDGEVDPQKGAKQQRRPKDTKDKRPKFVDS